MNMHEIRTIFSYEIKLGHSAAETARNINTAFRGGLVLIPGTYKLRDNPARNFFPLWFPLNESKFERIETEYRRNTSILYPENYTNVLTSRRIFQIGEFIAQRPLSRVPPSWSTK